MKKILSLAAILSLFAATSAQAITYYSDVDLIGEQITEGNHYQSNFNIKNNGGDSLSDIVAIVLQAAGDGFNPLKEKVTEAWAYFQVLDFDRDPELVKVKLGGDLFVSPTDFTVYGILGGNVDISGVMSLNDNGRVGYKVKSTQGDFTLLSAGLLAKTEPIPDSGSSLALLGVAFLGILGFRRRFQQR